MDKILLQAGLTVLEPAKAKILSAVFDYALENGFVFHSLREIAKGTGISHRMLIYHFGSQEKFWNSVFSYVRHVELNRSREQHVNCRNTEELRSALLRRWSLYSEREYLDFFRLLFEVYGYALSQPERFEQFLDTAVTPWLSRTNELFQQVGFSETTATARATLLVACIRGLLLDILTTGERDRVDAAAQEMVAMLCSEDRV